MLARGLAACGLHRAPRTLASRLTRRTPCLRGAEAAAAAPQPISLAEELLLLKFYGSKLQHMARELRFPRGVLGTALTFLRRFYLGRSALDQDPQQLVLTFLYLACKARAASAGTREAGATRRAAAHAAG